MGLRACGVSYNAKRRFFGAIILPVGQISFENVYGVIDIGCAERWSACIELDQSRLKML